MAVKPASPPNQFACDQGAPDGRRVARVPREGVDAGNERPGGVGTERSLPSRDGGDDRRGRRLTTPLREDVLAVRDGAPCDLDVERTEAPPRVADAEPSRACPWPAASARPVAACTAIAGRPVVWPGRESRRTDGRCPATRRLSVSNSLSGRHWELDQVPAVGDLTDIVQLGTGHHVSAGEGQRRVALQRRVAAHLCCRRPDARRHATLPRSWIQRENWEFETHRKLGELPPRPHQPARLPPRRHPRPPLAHGLSGGRGGRTQMAIFRIRPGLRKSDPNPNSRRSLAVGVAPAGEDGARRAVAA